MTKKWPRSYKTAPKKASKTTQSSTQTRKYYTNKYFIQLCVHELEGAAGKVGRVLGNVLVGRAVRLLDGALRLAMEILDARKHDIYAA